MAQRCTVARGREDKRVVLYIFFGNFAKVSVGDVVKRLSLGAGESFLWMGAGERLLTEYRLVTAEEGEMGCLHHLAHVVGDGQTYVEHPAFGGHVGVVSVGTTHAVEVLDRFGAEDVEVAVRKPVGHPGGGGGSEAEQGGENLHVCCLW